MITGAALKILMNYLSKDDLSFSELCEQAGYPTDLGGYYIRHLVAQNCLVKTGRGHYEITPIGKQHIISAMSKSKGPISHPRPCVILIAKQADKYLVMRRKRQPYIGLAEWPAVSIKVGESLDQALQRLFENRLGAIAPSTLLGFFRRIDIYEDIVFDDKLFAVYACSLPDTVIVSDEMLVGTNKLLTENEVLSIDKPARALYDILDFYKSPQQYTEIRYQLSLEDITSRG